MNHITIISCQSEVIDKWESKSNEFNIHLDNNISVSTISRGCLSILSIMNYIYMNLNNFPFQILLIDSSKMWALTEFIKYFENDNTIIETLMNPELIDIYDLVDSILYTIKYNCNAYLINENDCNNAIISWKNLYEFIYNN